MQAKVLWTDLLISLHVQNPPGHNATLPALAFVSTIQQNATSTRTGAYNSKNSTHYYLPGRAYLRQKSGQKQWGRYLSTKENAIFELSTLINPYLHVDTLFNLITFLIFLYILELSA